MNICRYSGYFVYKIATITLPLKKDKEFVARPITRMFWMLLADAYQTNAGLEIIFSRKGLL